MQIITNEKLVQLEINWNSLCLYVQVILFNTHNNMYLFTMQYRYKYVILEVKLKLMQQTGRY